MKSLLTSFLVAIVVLGCSLTSKAQLIQVTNTTNASSAYDPISLIETVFLSGGVNIDTVIYTGAPIAVGYFQNGGPSIGINEGIILTSGDAQNAIGPNGSGSTTTNSGITINSPELASIATGSINDLCQYEIRFTPTSNTLTFQYVFASEEYPEFVGSSFNDVFGFFLSAAGGIGPYTNIALIPNTNTAVSINNVNAGSNPAYYIPTPGSADIEYDAHTTVLTATATVIPCQLYTIKLAISDVGDGNLDSGVFLAANSFNSGSLLAIPSTPTPDTTLVEGCDDGSMTFSLTVPSDGPYPVTYTVGGTATMGVDYQNIPLSGVIPTGQTSFSFPITTIQDNIVEGDEYIEFIVFSNPCQTDTLRVWIVDNNLTLGAVDDAFVCPGGDIQYDATSPTPLPPSYNYTNTTQMSIDTGRQTSIMTVAGFPYPNITPNMIESVCIDITHFFVGDLDIFLIAPDGKFLELTTDNGAGGDHYSGTCFTPVATTSIVGSTAPFTGDFSPEGNWNFLNAATVNGDWRLQITDDGVGFNGLLTSWSINFSPLYDIEYTWSPTTNLSCVNCPDPLATPAAPTTYVVSATDSYGCTVTDTSDVSFGSQLPAPVITCGVATGGTVAFDWTAVPSASGYLVNVNGTGWVTPNGVLSHTVSGLSPGQSATIEVQAQSTVCPLPGLIGTHMCSAPNCSLTSAIDSVFSTSCFGGNDGRAYISAPTGIAPYTFDINGTAQNTGDFTGLIAGNYNVTVTDASGCFVIQPVSITEPTQIQSSFVTTNVNCNGGNDGTITVSSTGGTGTHTYVWSTVAMGTTINGLTIGTYTVTVTDANGCTHVNDTTLTEPTALALAVTPTDALCNGSSTGQVFVTPSGGTTGYTYAWQHDNTLTSDTANNLAIGTYTVTVTDANGCTASISGIVGEPTAVSVSTTSTDASCSGVMDGTATAIGSGGTGGYTYLWSSIPAQATATATNLSNGTYTVTVTDTNGCIATNTATINVPSPIFITSSTTLTSCFNGTDGTATIAASGGAGGFTYVWSTIPVQNTATATGLAAGNYTVTATDVSGCFVVEPIIITEPTQIQSSFVTTNVNCNGGNDGAITVSSTGGTGTHTYVWSTTATGATINGLTIGTYTVTVTDANGCTHINDTTLTEPTALVLAVTPTDALCNGSSTGQVFVTPSGGISGYTYAWQHDNTLTSDTANNLAIGTYTVTVTDANGCTASISGTVGEPIIVAVSTTSTDASCSGATDGTATATGSGGVSGYTYLWNSTPAQATATATNLSNGTYTVTVTDANGCTATNTATINVPSPIFINYTATPAACLGATDGTATATASGGAGGFSYAWNTTPTQNTALATGLGVGMHIVTVTDMDGCSDTAQVFVPEGSVVITPSLSMTPVSCNSGTDGTAMVSASGGTGTYNFIWDNSQTTPTITTLNAGTYYVTATDNVGCFGVDSIAITEPLALISTMAETNLSCFNNATGIAAVSVTGGTPTYQFNWDSGQTTATINGIQAGTYIVTITDMNSCTLLDTAIITQPDTLNLTMNSTQVSCNGSGDGTAIVVPIGGTMPYNYAWSTTPIQTTDTAIALNGGLYTVTVTDTNGCFSIDTVSVLERTDIQLSISNTSVNCYGTNDGTATVTATGGAANYQYAWSIIPTQNTSIATNLVAGFYTVTITDNDGCTDTISTTVIQPDSITLILNKTDISCFGANDGTATAAASGSVGAFTYAWNTTPTQTTATITGLSAGTYTVTTTDAQNCTKVASITIIEPAAITFTTSQMDLLCKDDLSGTATIAASGGAGGFTYIWSTTPVQTTATATGLDAGMYSFTVTDMNSCFTTGNVTLTEPDSLLNTTTSTNVTCFNGTDGTATTVPTGGTMGYNFVWSTTPIQTTATATGLTAGTYTVTITDANGCITIGSTILTEPTAIVTTVSNTNVTCFNGTDGSVAVMVSGGTPNTTGNYTYNWSPSGSTLNSVTNVAAGWHIVTVTDDLGCTIVDSIEVLQPTEILLTMSATPVVCSGDNNGTTTVASTGGTGTYTYVWNTAPAQTTATATGLTPGWYVVTVTDANNCIKVDSAEVTAPNALGIAVTGTNIDCYGNATGTADVIITGGVPAYTITWSNGLNTASINTLIAGTYVVTVSDMNGCSLVDSVTLTEPAAPLQVTLTDFEVNCNGGNDGSITSVVTGGTGPYFYSWNSRPIQTTPNATGLTAGLYTLVITDANGCMITDSIEVEEPAPITLLMNETGSSCNGGNDGTATVAASGGVPGYTYNWNSIPSQSTTTATNLVGGQTYTVIVTDTRGCSETQSITISQPDLVTVTTIQDNISCFGLTDGTATVQASGGTPAYFYQWDDNANNQSTAQAINLGAGTYTVTVTDTLGCFTTTQVTITEPADLFNTTSTEDVSCFGEFSGTATAQVAGGTAPYNVIWDSNTGNIVNNTTISNVAAGTYFLTFTDANGCQLSDSVIINQPASALVSTLTGLDASCYDERDGEISIGATGGTPPYQHSLDAVNYSNTIRLVGITAGDYTVHSRDANGCLVAETVSISEPNEFTISAIPDQEIEMGTLASLGVVFNNGVAPFSLLWTPSDMVNCATCQFPVADSLTETTYFTVFAVDANGCEAEDETIVRIDRPRRVFVANGFTPNGDGNNDNLFVQGGTGTQSVKLFKVYDRWGELVFESYDAPLNDPDAGWDATFKGKPVNPGIFAYIVEVEFIDGKVIQYKGSTVVIR